MGPVRGLEIAQRTGGVNPYRYDFVGASDFHNGLSTSSEDAYVGVAWDADPSRPLPDRDALLKRFADARETTASIRPARAVLAVGVARLAIEKARNRTK
jgi:hypothetical protein